MRQEVIDATWPLRTIEVVGELPAINFALGWDGEIRLALA